MAMVFHARLYGRFIEIYEQSLEKYFIERIKAPNFLEVALAIETTYEHQSNLEEKDSPSISKTTFSEEQSHPFSHQ